jgi:mono/diheme cytochrome c family protein
MSTLRWALLATLVAAAVVFAWLLSPSRSTVVIAADESSAIPGMAERGLYLVRAGGCDSCHTNRKAGGERFAGGVPLKTPFGVFYTPNITPDDETGIGRWTDEDFVRAMTQGEGAHGEDLYPVFPYTSYSRMTAWDALAIKSYLFNLEPVKAARQPNEIAFPFSWRALLKGWKLLFFSGAMPLENDPSRETAWNRGRYLVKALGHCGECHTPRNLLGAQVEAEFLQGNPSGPEGWKVPALMGAKASKFDQWSVEEIEEYLKSGVKPDFDSAQGPMADVIEESTKHLDERDRRAIALYLKSLNGH